MEQLCWTCKNATGGCSWSEFRRFEVPEGAVVKEYKTLYYKRINGVRDLRPEEHTMIVQCPLYEMDERTKKAVIAKEEYEREHPHKKRTAQAHWRLSDDGLLICGQCGATYPSNKDMKFCAMCGKRNYAPRKERERKYDY